MRAGLFAIRHQCAGVVADPIYSAEPDAEVLAAEKARLDKIHGPGWVRPWPVALVLAPEHEDLAARLAATPEPPPTVSFEDSGLLPGMRVRAVGHVTPPDER
ncbi:hypothetical protein [Sorangium sp. So ce388]|uniref:hypothetical protein n=1 Tax=Sorangium sp. So ce388 TaxID=3133309 RepID=UPI003F5B2A83